MATRAQVEESIGTFAETIGLAGLAFDRTDSCSVMIEERIPIDFFFDEAEGRLVLETVLGVLPETGRGTLVAKLARGNTLGIETRGGTLALGPDGEILLMRELRHAAFDYPMLERALIDQIEAADRWRQEVEGGADEAGEPELAAFGMFDPTRFA